MTIEQFTHVAGFDAVCMPDPEKEINGAYVGDLLSWVMGNATAGNVWVTIMSNSNIVAVASLTDVSCILLAEGVEIDRSIVDVAVNKGVNILATKLSSYEASVQISRVVS